MLQVIYSDTGSWIRNGTTNPNPDFPKQLSFASLFPAYNSDTETDASSESNEIPPKLALYSNFIMSFFLASLGSICHATLDDGRVVAIKRAEISKSKPYESYVNDCKYHDNAFQSELKALSRLNHKNLVP
uniref:Protein kinase domain-containing protein n=1 Tax=Quercus lobata TaxID=97700 RepID=A0A7N2N882_QUELO